MKKKIFIGTIEIAGYFGNLAKGMRSLGEDVTFVNYSTNPFNYPGEDSSYITKLIKLIFYKYANTLNNEDSFAIKIFWGALWELLKFFNFLFIVARHDIFIFGFGQSLLRGNFDLIILKALGKKIIFNMALGSESRPPYIDGSYQSASGDGQSFINFLRKTSIRRIKRLKKIQKYSDFVILAPYISHFAEGKVINHFAIGLPVEVNYSQSHSHSHTKTDVVTILHAPSNMIVKGTHEIRLVINKLQKKGYQIEYIELQGKPNIEVLDALSKCSFVIDQLYSDWPLPVFATEAAFFGKPAIVSGYGLDNLKALASENNYPPSFTCLPDNLEVAVEKMIVDINFRNKIGKKAQDFVQKEWTPEKVACRYLSIINGHIPKSWWFDPRDFVYVFGCGLSQRQVKSNIKAMIESYGISSLQLKSRPDLVRSFLYFSGS